MKMVAVTTVRDEGAAQMAEDVLKARDMPVECRRISQMVYLGSAPAQIEVRVPEDRLEEARAALAQLEVEIEQAVLAEAGVPPEEAPPGKQPTDETGRPRKIGWAVAFALIAPVPCLPVGMIYARAPSPLCFALFGVAGALMLAGMKGGSHSDWMIFSFLGARVIDVVLAPIFAVRENRRLQRLGIEVRATRVPTPVIIAVAILVAVFAVGFYLAATREPWSPDHASDS